MTETLPMHGLSGALAFVPIDQGERTLATELTRSASSRIEEYVGERLCSCDSLPQFQDAFEALLEDPEFYRLQRELVESLPLVKMANVSPEPPESYRRAFGREHLDQLNRIGELMVATARAVLQALAVLHDSRVRGDVLAHAREAVAAAPMFYLVDPMCPPAVRHALLGGDRASLAAIGVAAAAHGRRMRRDLLKVLFDEWETGQRELLRLIAAFEGVTLPSVLEPSDVLPLAELMRETARANEVYERQLQAARATGAEVYPPIQHPIDD